MFKNEQKISNSSIFVLLPINYFISNGHNSLNFYLFRWKCLTWFALHHIIQNWKNSFDFLINYFLKNICYLIPIPLNRNRDRKSKILNLFTLCIYCSASSLLLPLMATGAAPFSLSGTIAGDFFFLLPFSIDKIIQGNWICMYLLWLFSDKISEWVIAARNKHRWSESINYECFISLTLSTFVVWIFAVIMNCQ